MLSIFELDSYKKHLISYYYYECDNNETHQEKRRALIERQYSDDYLIEIIKNTERFIEILIQRTVNSNRTFIEFEISGDNKDIFTNCTGGYHPDTLIPIFNDAEDAYISTYLLKQFLGKDFRIDFDENIEEIIDDEDDDIIIGGIYYTPKMIIVEISKHYQKNIINYKVKKRY